MTLNGKAFDWQSGLKRGPIQGQLVAQAMVGDAVTRGPPARALERPVEYDARTPGVVAMRRRSRYRSSGLVRTTARDARGGSPRHTVAVVGCVRVLC